MKAFILLALTCLTLAACGVKPGDVDPPPGAEGSTFPHTYPASGVRPAS